MKELFIICGIVAAVICGISAKENTKGCYWISGEPWESPLHCLECGAKLKYALINGQYLGCCDNCGARVSLPDSIYPQTQAP